MVIVAQRGWVGPPARKTRRSGRFAAAKSKAVTETESGRRSFDEYLRSFQLSESGEFSSFLHEAIQDADEAKMTMTMKMKAKDTDERSEDSEKKDESDATSERGDDGKIEGAQTKTRGARARAKRKLRGEVRVRVRKGS